MQIMDGIELRPEDFPTLVQMMQVSTGKILTGVAAAVLV